MNIAIAAYNRPESLKRLLNSIYKCNGYETVEVFVFLDKQGDKNLKSDFHNLLKPFKNISISESEVRLGLLENIHSIFSWAATQAQPTIILEDDLYLSVNALNYASQALNYYRNDENTGMISLYHQHYIYTNEFPFMPLSGDSDVYFMQFPSSSGFAVTPEMAARYMQYVSGNNTNHELLPLKIQDWPASSWKRLFAAYLAEKNLFTVFPRISLSTNFGDKGENHSTQSHYFQSPISVSAKNSYTFSTKENTAAVYDIYMEWLPGEKLFPQFKDICFDLNGFKPSHHLYKPQVISTRMVKNPAASFARALKPQEANIIENIPGNIFHKYHRDEYQQAILPKDYYKELIDYHYIFTSRSKLAGYLKDSLF